MLVWIFGVHFYVWIFLYSFHWSGYENSSDIYYNFYHHLKNNTLVVNRKNVECFRYLINWVYTPTNKNGFSLKSLMNELKNKEGQSSTLELKSMRRNSHLKLQILVENSSAWLWNMTLKTQTMNRIDIFEMWRYRRLLKFLECIG